MDKIILFLSLLTLLECFQGSNRYDAA